MSRQMAPGKNRILTNYLLISSLGLAFCFLSPPLSAQDNQTDAVSAAPMQQDQQDPQYQSAPNQDMQQSPQGQDMQQPPSQQALPRSLTLPAGTVIRVRVNEWLSSDRNLPGDEFGAELDQPIVVDGWVVARRGQSETGRVSVAKKSRGSGTSQLGVELSEFTLVDGQQLPIQTQLLQSSASNSNGRNAAVVGATAGIGAAIGAIAGGGPGAAIGAIAGGTAGVVGVYSTPGKPTVISPESVLSFRLQAPVTISTEKSQFAFQPVTQTDYNKSRPPAGNRRPRLAGPGGQGYPPPPPYYGYPYAYGYPYPYAYYPGPLVFGFGYGFGPRFGGFRGFRR